MASDYATDHELDRTPRTEESWLWHLIREHYEIEDPDEVDYVYDTITGED